MTPWPAGSVMWADPTISISISVAQNGSSARKWCIGRTRDWGGMAFPLVRRAGRLTLSAEDLLLMAVRQQGFQVMGAFAPEHATEYQSGKNAVRVLLETLGQSSSQ